MAKVIEFYIPDTFRKRTIWIPPEQRGKVIEFCLRNRPKSSPPIRKTELRYELVTCAVEGSKMHRV